MKTIPSNEEVRAVLQRFQDGYTQRDPKGAEAFMQLFAAGAAPEVVGTAGTQPGDDEWPLGAEAVRGLVESDWLYWGDLRLDVPGACIHTSGEVAWLSTTATVTSTLHSEVAYANYLDYIANVLQDKDQTAEARLMEILRGGTNTVFEVGRGEQYVWPLRFTAVLVHSEGQWRFHQIHFSFPTTRFPDVRLTESESEIIEP